MICLFSEIFWRVEEVILKQYWRVLYEDSEEVFNEYYEYISDIFPV
jgi:hypothetical protein